MKNIIFKGVDDSVAIMTLVAEADKEDAIQKFRDSQPKGFFPEYYEIDVEIPSNREFRDAWTMKDNKVVVDERKARDIHMSRIRHARNEELKKLDAEHLRVLGDKEQLKVVEDKKQELRDLPANWVSLEWPDILPER